MSATILIIDDDESTQKKLARFLSPLGYETQVAATLAEARRKIAQGLADIVLLDVELPDGFGPSLLEDWDHIGSKIPVIVITGHGDIEMAVEAMKNGAHDFIQKPIKLDRLGKSVQRASELVALHRELDHYRQSRLQEIDFIIGSSPQMQEVMKKAQRAAETCVSVLITGETGTGKEVIANAIHQMGPRAQKPFIPIICPAIQSTVIESELFGHEPGAYTSAEKRKPGLMETADGGILFLDEISSMPVDIQAKLLRALDQQSFFRVGGNNLIHVDVQVIAASNRDLKKMIEKEEFRSDLYYRLKVIDLHLPPLRERKQDIPELVGYFIRKFNQNKGLNILDITPRALERLMQYPWPGNIRELKHAIEHAMLLCDEERIDIPHLPAELR